MSIEASKPFVMPEMRFTVDVLDRKDKWKPIVGGFKHLEKADEYGRKYCRAGRWRTRDRTVHFMPDDLTNAK